VAAANSLTIFSLAIPISAIILYLNLDEALKKQAVTVIIVLAAVSALWAMLQLAGPSRGPLYPYNITNNGTAVGLFANRNHQAVLLAATIVMLGWYAASHAPVMRLAALKFYGSISGVFVLVPLIFITGSRAGLILMAPAIVVVMVFIYFGRFTAENKPAVKKSNSAKKRRLSSRQLILFGSLAAVVTVAALSIYFSRSLAFDRLFGGNELGELRAQLVPILFNMMGDYFPWGSGFGTFEYVYRIYEPQELLNPSYLNQAHNDWLQFPIEGGAPAVLISVAVIIWFILKLVVLGKNWHSSRYTKYTALMAATVMLFFLAGSAGDYPLRIPSLIAVFAVMACVFNDAVDAVQRKDMKSPR